MTTRFSNFGSDGNFIPRGCPDGLIICENIADYPIEHINEIVKANPILQDTVYGDEFLPEVVQRVDYPDGESMCQSKHLIMHPTEGKTKDETWAFIINNKDVSQGVRVEICL